MTTAAATEIPDALPHGRLFRLNAACGDLAPVLVSHGTFSDFTTCLPVAEFFARAGHPTFILEWRGRDVGRGNRLGFTYWDLAEDEFRAACDHIFTHLNRPCHIVAHSGGGLAAALMLADQADARAKVGSLAMLATQSTHLGALPLRARLSIAAITHLARLPGYWPKSLMKLGPTNENAPLKVQWHGWNRRGVITCRDGTDLFDKLASVTTPALAIAGKADLVIAPQQGCRALLEAFSGPKSFIHAGKSEGFSEEFDHSRLWKSRAAERDLWPLIGQWITTHTG